MRLCGLRIVKESHYYDALLTQYKQGKAEGYQEAEENVGPILLKKRNRLVEIIHYRETIRHLYSLAGSVKYVSNEDFLTSFDMADEITELITKLERKVGDII